jgi:hypothetical protein
MLTRMSDAANSDPRARTPAEAPNAEAGADPSANGEDPGVLASLPHTRPQRASARRAAARARASRASQASRATAQPSAGTPRGAPATALAASSRDTTKPRPKAKPRTAGTRATSGAGAATAARAAGPRASRKPSSRASASRKPVSKRKPAATRRALQEPAPRQGYETEPDYVAGPVQPPGSTELVASAAELAGELAKTGVSTGARLIKDLLSRLPG